MVELYHREAGFGLKFYRESGKQTPSGNREKLVLYRDASVSYIGISFPEPFCCFVFTGKKIVYGFPGMATILSGLGFGLKFLLGFGIRGRPIPLIPSYMRRKAKTRLG